MKKWESIEIFKYLFKDFLSDSEFRADIFLSFHEHILNVVHGFLH